MNIKRTFSREEVMKSTINDVDEQSRYHINRLLRQCNVLFEEGGNKEKIGSVLYFMEDNTKPISDSNKLAGSLQVNLVYVDGAYIAEIYNLCISPSLVENPVDVTRFLLEEAIKQLKSEQRTKDLDILIWIGIDIENKYFMSIAYELAKLHFSVNGIQEGKRPSGFVNEHTTVVSFIRKNTNNIPPNLPITMDFINQQTGISSYMYDRFNLFIAKCSKLVTISPKLALGLRDLAYKQYGEVSGFFYLTRKKYSETFEGEYIMGSAISGPNSDLIFSTDDKCAVMFTRNPVAKIVFHTHPYSCYSQYNLQIGWPSGIDFATSVVQFCKSDPLYAQLTVSIEGIYAIRPMKGLAQNMYKKLGSSLEVLIKFGDAMKEYWVDESLDFHRNFMAVDNGSKGNFHTNPYRNYRLFHESETGPRVIDALGGIKAITYQTVNKHTNFEKNNNIDNDSSDFPLVYLEYWDWDKIMQWGLSFAILDKSRVGRKECVQWDIDDIPVGKDITV
jgi:hypothetical protein